MKLIVGLGNPGNEYKNTRHNVGYMMLDALAQHLNVSFDKRKFCGSYAEFNCNSEKYLLLKPEKFMNLSGEVIKDFMNYFKIDIKDILIVHDDLDTAIGTYRLRYQGGNGGHNGLKNIELHLHTKVYNRMKIGISNNKNIDTKDYVLGKFSKDELDKLHAIFPIFIDIIDDYGILSFDNLMNKYNKR